MGLLELCRRYYNSDNLYEILQIPKKATIKEVHTAYRKLSLKVHPDRVTEDEKLEATEKFKVLSSIHKILSDERKRACYDKTNCVDDDDDIENINHDWLVYWKFVFKDISIEDIEEYKKKYIGSEEEKEDLKVAYLTGKGDMNYIVERVQFVANEDEPRIRGVLHEMIEKKEIPAYKIFTHEPAGKRKRRHAKLQREAKEAEEMSEKMGLKKENNLELMIKKKNESRAQNLDSLIANLEAKYGGKTTGSKRKATSMSEKGSKNKRKK